MPSRLLPNGRQSRAWGRRGRPNGALALSLDEVSQTLWHERQLLDLLVCKLEVKQLVLAVGRNRLLPAVTREVEHVVAELKEVELLRAVLIDAVAEQAALEPGITLRQLAESAPSPWDTIFELHRMAFLVTVEELRSVARINRDLLAQGARAVQDALAGLCERAERAGPDSYSLPYRAAVIATSGVLSLSLAEFLR
jgi:hypothetical protein